MHYHLDPVGGVAGDMFAAAMLDCHPDWQPQLAQAFACSEIDTALSVAALPHHDGVLSGHRFEVSAPPESHSHKHRHWRELRGLIQRSNLASAVRRHTLEIFSLLATAEAQVHGVDVEEVAFHEVGAWDSVADVVTAAWLIDKAVGATWSCGPVPQGRGRVTTAHGVLPVPAPATALLLKGFPLFDDGVEGERVTPTGAAILRYLAPELGARTTPLRLTGDGYGFGSKLFPGFSNTLRVLAFDTCTSAPSGNEEIAVCRFEVDDQTPEDLAVALQHLRATEGVLDVQQSAVVGKHGRLGAQVQVLAAIQRIDSIVDRCLIETTTLGVRWQTVQRRTLSRSLNAEHVAGEQVRVKRAYRPNDVVTEKAEMTDLADVPGGHAGRQQRRLAAESAAARRTPGPSGEPEQ